MSDHPVKVAIPGNGVGAPDQDLLRALIMGRLVLFLPPDDDPEAFDPTDTDTGTIVPIIAWQEHFFWYDPDDTTSVHDGTSVLVTLGGYRFISVTQLHGDAVLSITETTPPETTDSPPVSLGDAYIVPTGAAGDWAGHEDEIALWTARGWGFITPHIGLLVHVEDEDGFFHFTQPGVWQQGLGQNTYPDGSILPSALQAGKNFWIVENQTTNTPPTVSDGVAYIVGSSPTGVWSGHTGKIANRENSEWVIYTQAEGWRAYDKATDRDYQWSGTAWISATGRFRKVLHTFGSSSTFGKHARSIGVQVYVVAGGGGSAGTSGSGGAGGTSSFGSHCSATGGGGGTSSAGGAGGGGSGGDWNWSGQPGQFDSVGDVKINGGLAGFVGGTAGRGGATLGGAVSLGSGGGGGAAVKWIAVADLATNETVTIGAAGAAGTGGPAGAAGAGGSVFVEEYIED